MKITGCSSIFDVRQHVTFTAGGLSLAKQTTQTNPVIALGAYLQGTHTENLTLHLTIPVFSLGTVHVLGCN